MRTVLGFLCACALLCGTARAQVINGEGDYEGSSLHTPPPQTDADAAPKPADGKKVPEDKMPAAAPPAR